MAGDNFDALRKVLSDKPRRMEGSGTSGGLAHMRNIRDWRENVAEEASPPVLAALLAERDALQADAERYRWLRSDAAWKHLRVVTVGLGNGPFYGERLDATVDAARAALDAGRMDGEKAP